MFLSLTFKKIIQKKDNAIKGEACGMLSEKSPLVWNSFREAVASGMQILARSYSASRPDSVQNHKQRRGVTLIMDYMARLSAKGVAFIGI